MKTVLSLLLVFSSAAFAKGAARHGDLSFLSAYGRVSCPGNPRQAAGGCAVTIRPGSAGNCEQMESAVWADLKAHGYAPGLKIKNGDTQEVSHFCLDGLDGYYSTIYFSPYINPCVGKSAAQLEYIDKVAAQRERDYPGQSGFRCH